MQLCEHPPPQRARDRGVQRCPLWRGHAGGHRYWQQMPGVFSLALWVYDEHGGVHLHAQLKGPQLLEPDEVGAMLEYLAALRLRSSC